MARVLVVDDDPTVREVVRAYLERDDHAVVEAAAADGVVTAAAGVDLVVLDVMLPDGSGLDVCRELRAAHPALPVVLLTALGEEDDRVDGLERGADDYVVKPFSPRELALRVRSLLRRAGRDGEPAAPTPGTPLVDGDLAVDPRARTATRAGADLQLTSRELDLLVHLLRHPARAFSREELLREVWGWEFGDLSTVTVHVRRLRTKVEPDPATPSRLVTVWGVGYRWDPA